ncbi:MAG TPA: hypothetical protein VFV38_21680 [Ktedonobacteraceae bacterium]|nr:hypothetical protein [Ktedonobacteraceae bacterium]
MTQTDKKGITEASSDAAPALQPISDPPEIPLQLQLKWGLALLGEEKAKEYLAWLQVRLGEDRQLSHNFAKPLTACIAIHSDR